MTAHHIEAIGSVLNYWFGTTCTEHQAADEKAKIWFSGGAATDREIRERFGGLVEQARNGQLDHWAESPRGRLALIILLDQFTRNMFRGSPEAFAKDAHALMLTRRGVQAKVDHELRPIERIFFYMPLMHAEDLDAQNLGVEVFTKLAQEVPESARSAFEANRDYAIRHRRVIERFGRFPHRNDVLGRVSTGEERDFLESDEAPF